MLFEEALDTLSRDDRFKATVYAMNSLLMQKGIYSLAEFQKFFTEWAEKQHSIERAGDRSPLLGAHS